MEVTNIEAIDILISHRMCAAYADSEYVDSIDIEAVDMAISALRKQEGKEPKIVGETEYSFFVDCPTCGRRLINNLDGEWIAGEKSNYCPCCGQKILWE